MKLRKLSALSLTLSIVTLALAGCAVGPKYERADVDTPKAFKESAISAGDASRWQAAQPADQLARGEWWAIFHDAALDDLEAQATGANQDLKAAAARLRQARALQVGVRSALYPQLDAGVGATRERQSPAARGISNDAPSSASTLYRAQLGVSYEVDLFGRVSSAVSAGAADLERSEALYRSVELALQADVAQAYFLVRQLDAAMTLYANTVTLREKGFGLMQRRFDAGDITELDLSRAKSELASARAEYKGFERQRAVAEHALAILLGKTPAEFSFPAQPIARVAVAIPAGLPSQLLERRPDIAAAERAMAAANARIGVAKAAFYPRVSLTGSFGSEASNLGDLFSWSSRMFLLGPAAGLSMVSLPIFDGGRRRSDLDRARARYDEDVSAYRQTVLNGFREVEDNLSSLRLIGEQTAEQDDAVASAARAAKISQVQYREGSASFLDVLDADRNVLTQRRVSVQLDGERARYAVNLIRAIGGAWQPATRFVFSK
ncbi:efflux transporter outer membrane subunit [Cupriavidus sp. CV2]|uniref:efflux transporter outer membrane subunit n=1 Tax=Cupriavidus ulmosensis TaxID=3065913 RepID=UPI00296AB65F|nr:efflux transporter outer membrane subunit [Cupriavidus sp. CV2]MDW3688539.1 efflux transporter outer membrane subunit [Cupriavidus sp. CV2]